MNLPMKQNDRIDGNGGCVECQVYIRRQFLITPTSFVHHAGKPFFIYTCMHTVYEHAQQ